MHFVMFIRTYRGDAGPVIHGPLPEVDHFVRLIRHESIVFPTMQYCVTPMPAYVCKCGQVRFILEYPDEGGAREWLAPNGAVQRQAGFPGDMQNVPPRLAGAIRSILERVGPLLSDQQRALLQEATRQIVEGVQSARAPREAPWALPREAPWAFEGGVVVDGETVKTLVDLARQNQEREFRDMAVCVGVPSAQLDELWDGTRKRVSRER